MHIITKWFKTLTYFWCTWFVIKLKWNGLFMQGCRLESHTRPLESGRWGAHAEHALFKSIAFTFTSSHDHNLYFLNYHNNVAFQINDPFSPRTVIKPTSVTLPSHVVFFLSIRFKSWLWSWKEAVFCSHELIMSRGNDGCIVASVLNQGMVIKVIRSTCLKSVSPLTTKRSGLSSDLIYVTKTLKYQNVTGCAQRFIHSHVCMQKKQ